MRYTRIKRNIDYLRSDADCTISNAFKLSLRARDMLNEYVKCNPDYLTKDAPDFKTFTHLNLLKDKADAFYSAISIRTLHNLTVMETALFNQHIQELTKQ